MEVGGRDGSGPLRSREQFPYPERANRYQRGVRMFRRPSPAIVISLLALFIALGGAGYSATGGNFILGRSNSASSQSALVAPFKPECRSARRIEFNSFRTERPGRLALCRQPERAGL